MESYKKAAWISASLAVVIALMLIIYLFFIKGGPGAEKSSPPTDDTVSQRPVVPPSREPMRQDEQDLTPLDVDLNESDGKVRELLKDCSSHPVFARWLGNRDLVRRFTAIANNIAHGDSPAAHLEFMQPLEKFMVTKKEGKLCIDPESYRRYDLAAAVFVSLDSRKLAALYRRAQPLIDEAFKELGFPEKRFADELRGSVRALLQVPVIEGDIVLEEKVTSYAFKDPRLESLDDAQKHLLRMGPENIKKVQKKLKELALLLNLNL